MFEKRKRKRSEAEESEGFVMLASTLSTWAQRSNIEVGSREGANVVQVSCLRVQTSLLTCLSLLMLSLISLASLVQGARGLPTPLF